MNSTATVRRISSRTIQNEETGEEVPVWDDVYVGRFRLGGAGGAGTRAVDVGGVEAQVAVRVAHFPADADLADGDLIDVTTGDGAGLVLRIVEAAWQDQATARRVPVVSTGRPSEWS